MLNAYRANMDWDGTDKIDSNGSIDSNGIKSKKSTFWAFGDCVAVNGSEDVKIDKTTYEAGCRPQAEARGPFSRETAFDFVTMLYEKTTGEKESGYLAYIEDENAQKSDSAEDRTAQGGVA